MTDSFFRHACLLAACMLAPATATAADWVLSRGASDGRLLSLIRQPRVLADLALNDKQRSRILQLNQELDGPLLSMRNWRAEWARKQLDELTTRTRKELRLVLKPKQFNRLAQIMFYAQGYRSVGGGPLAKTLKLTKSQTEAIGEVVRAGDLKFSKRTQADLWTDAAALKTALAEEDRRVLAILEPAQREALDKLAGRKFDRSTLTGIRLNAPRFVGREWLNSEQPLKMSGLRGNVVIVHFWAFG